MLSSESQVGDLRPNMGGIVDLVTTALAQEDRAGLSEMLRLVARTADAVGCILWQEVPHVSQLFVLADGFLGEERSFLHNLSLLQSATGKAILEGRTISVENVATDSRVDRRDPFLEKAGIRCFCSIPLVSIAGKRGALNVYRNMARPFQVSEIKKLEEMAHLIPSLYETITDKISYRLVHQVSQILQAGNEQGGQGTSSRRQAQKLCACIAATFDAMEVSLFLEERLTWPGLYRLAATTWPQVKKISSQTFKADTLDGLTGWVLAQRRSLRLFDLAQLERERNRLRSIYTGLTWKDPQKIVVAARNFLGVPQAGMLQPLCFMAVPIVAAGRLLGAIRCCTAVKGPYYFSEREENLLNLVALQIGQAWNIWLSRREIEEENQIWKRLVDSMRALNLFVAEQVDKEISDKSRIFEKALELAHDVIPGADILDIRLLDHEKRELYFEATHGKAWRKGEQSKIAQRRDRRFKVDGDPPPCGGAVVVRTGKVYHIHDTQDSRYHYSETFEGTKRMIIAPIRVAEKILGVLDIRGAAEREFPPYAEQIADLLGQQLGLYYDLMQTFTELQRFQRAQVQTFEDFTHQLKSPILQVHARIQSSLRLTNQESCSVESLRPHLLAIRGLAAKAKSVTHALGLFSDLASGKPLRPTLARLSADFVKTVIEAAIDQESTLDPERKLRFSVEREGFEVLRSTSVVADASLLLQALNNVLDNAAKYSDPDSTVRVSAGLTNTGRFHITVWSKGLPMTASDIRLCRKRGWRSDRASEVTGEGSGIGLWIVDHIMMAHQGELLITPTTPDSWTEVKLVFHAPDK